MQVNIGAYNDLAIARLVDFGAYLDDGKDGILLPKRFLPAGAQVGDVVRVFLYHDGESRLIATTQQPYGVAGDIVKLRAVDVAKHGAFLDNGLMKDLFVPNSKMKYRMKPGAWYLVHIYIDIETGRLAATEKFDYLLSNDKLTVQERDSVQLVVYRRTDIGYVVIINHQHTGVLHFSDIFGNIQPGDKLQGYVKKIYDDNRIDVGAGRMGYARVSDKEQKIMELLQSHDGFLPYHDKSTPEVIYEVFGMSKKTFKMTVGKLYKEKKISLEPKGIRLL